MNRKTLSIVVLAGAFLPIGCGKHHYQIDRDWSSPVIAASSIGRLGGAPRLHPYQEKLMGVQVLMDGSPNLLLWNPASGTWLQSNNITTPRDALWGGGAIDSKVGRVVLPNGYAENEQLVIRVTTGTLAGLSGIRDIAETSLRIDKSSLFGETGPNVHMSESGRRSGVGFGPGILNGPNASIPYWFVAKTSYGINNSSNGPFVNGVIHSTDGGRTWRIENVSHFHFRGPQMCRTAAHEYYFAIRFPITWYGLWVSQRSVSGPSWQEPKSVTKDFANVNGLYAVAASDETAHVVWMDRRHNKWRFNLTSAPIENNDIYYRRRQDSDPDWGKEVHLSKGLTYCYAPTIAAEGDNVVVAWAGIREAGKRHTDMGPNDIYYVTSKDRGKTWSKSAKVTDNAKDGITAGMPQVALLDGVIHLLYVQGANRSPGEISPGLTRLGNEPWPIYYQHRPFPK